MNIKTLKKGKFIMTVLFGALLMLSPLVHAQTPDWQINPADYSGSMTYTGFIIMNQENVGHPDDRVGAFYADQTRGVAHPEWFEASGQWIFFMVIYGNINNQEIRFRYYNSVQNQVYDLYTTIGFGSDLVIGSAFEPRATSDVALTEALFYSFSIPGQQFSEIKENEIIIVPDPSINLMQVNAHFEASVGALVKVGEMVQISGESYNDFSQGLTYTVRSGDEQTTKTYQVRVVTADHSQFAASSLVTPNGDGINDTWKVQDVEKFHDSVFTIFDFSGRVVFESTGYDNSWGGIFNNSLLPLGTYYYTVKSSGGRVARGVISLVY